MLINNSLKLLACTVALSAASMMASAQTKEVSHDFSSFNAISVDNDFAVSFEKSKKDYSVTINVDSVLKEFVETYVKNHTLYIELDQKSIPADVKKLYKGKNEPVMNVTVYAPEFINDITMGGGSSLTIGEEVECDEFTLTLKENANVKKLVVDAANITINSANKATGIFSLYADNLTVNADGNSALDINTESELVNVNADGSCEINLQGKAVTTTLTTKGSSKTKLEGQTTDLNITGSDASNVDAINFKTNNANVKISNFCKVTEAATDNLTVDLSGNSSLIFDCEPVVKVENIKSSTMTRYANVKK